MKIQLTKMERTAGLFVMIAVGSFCFFTVVVAIKQGWFSARRHFRATFTHGDGLHPGTMIQISGLRAGAVDMVKLNEDNRIEVELTVSSDFDPQLRKDSVARVIRPFIIGDKVVEITVGSKGAEKLSDLSLILSEDTMDIMDLLGGGRLGPYLASVDSLLSNLKVLAEAFGDAKRSEALIELFDETLPTLRGLRELTGQATKNKNLAKSMQNLTKLTSEVNRMLPDVVEFSKHLPELGESSTKTLAQLQIMTEELNKFLPLLAQIAPQLPEASQNGIAALKEAVIVLRAIQKSFLLRGAVSDVKEEDAKKKSDEDKQRKPAEEAK